VIGGEIPTSFMTTVAYRFGSDLLLKKTPLPLGKRHRGGRTVSQLRHG
jgi:hypothetical protein